MFCAFVESLGMIEEFKLKPLKSERHHWWPQCVSEHWNDNGGSVHWVQPSGEVVRAPAKRFGVIGNAHHFKPGGEGDHDPWNFTFEPEFNRADGEFPAIIEWLQGLDCKHVPLREAQPEGFKAHPADDKRLATLVECIVSLVVRSPKFRETGVSQAEHFRGPLEERERNNLITLNIMHCQRRLVESIGTRGKFAVLFTHEREFHYGDGFYHNLSSQTQDGFNARILVPITPNIAVFYCCPNRYMTEPRLVTLMLTDDEVTTLNQTIQIYAKDFLFFRAEKPDPLEVYKIGEHRIYGDRDPFDDWVQSLSGLPPEPTRIHLSL